MINTASKKFLIQVMLVLICTCCIGLNKGVAQRDMILTQAGEQIRCRIIDETPVRFVFAYLKNGKPYRSEIFKNLVTSFKFNYYDSELPNADKLPEAMYRATDGVDSQSPRALSSTVKKNGNRLNEKKRRRKKSKDKVEEKAEEAVAAAKEVTRKVDEKVIAAQNTNVPAEPVSSAKPEQKILQPQQDSATKQPQAQKNKAQEVEGIPQAPVKAVVNPTAKNESMVIEKVPAKSEKSVAKQADNTSTVSPTSESRTRNAVPETKIEQKADTSPVTVGGKNVVKVDSKTTVNEVANSAPDITDAELPNITISQENKFRIGIKGGIGNRLDNNLQTINSYDLYLEQLLRGWTLGADIAYFPNDVVGFGAIFTDFKSRNSDSEILYRNEFTGAEQIGSIANNRSVKFIGPALFLRKKLDYKTYVVLGLAPGYNFYRDRGSYDGVDYTFRGGGFGAASTLGIDFLLGNDIIGRDIILSFEAGYNYGLINALDYGDARGLVDLATPLDVSRLDFTVGLRFIRFPKYFRLTSY